MRLSMTKRQSNVLIVDPALRFRNLLAHGLAAANYVTVEAVLGSDAIRHLTLKEVDLIILEPDLPDMDGAEVLERLRTWSTVPVVVLSTRTMVDEKVRFLDLGADDYLTKPFSMDELLARMRALLRRRLQQTFGRSVLEIDRLKIDFATRTVFVQDEEVKFRPKEYMFLEMLARQAGHTVDQQHLLTEIWGPEHAENVEYLRVAASRLRAAIELEPSRPKIILTDVGVGYRLASPIKQV
jgi:two-component system KDP operon response regulator KdpE